MNKSDFNFVLPPHLIAQTPIERREQSRLLRLDRSSGEINHSRFFELPGFLRKGDCLVLNDSRVLPARLFGRRKTGGVVEVVLLCNAAKNDTAQSVEGEKRKLIYLSPTHESQIAQSGVSVDQKTESGGQSETIWECLARPGRKAKTGTDLIFGNGELTATVVGETDGGNRLIKFKFDGIFLEVLERLGKMPLPPYIREELKDNERYQTVYSRVTGSAAAPTAGLHFTNELLGEIKAHGVEVCYITLHVGLGTFRPVKADIIEEHKMHEEYFVIPGETEDTVNRIKDSGGRIIAVGTTSCRTLEACADDTGKISKFSGFTDIFIYPGYKFKCIDALITNFHLPESTLIMLVSALAGRENILQAYNEAIDKQYRFFSFGDAMLII